MVGEDQKLKTETTDEPQDPAGGIAGAMSFTSDEGMDLSKVFAPATEVPKEEATSGDPTAGGVRIGGIGQLFGPGSPWADMVKRRKEKKEARQAKKARTGQGANDDANKPDMTVLGQGGQPNIRTKISAKTLAAGFPSDEEDEQGEKR